MRRVAAGSEFRSNFHLGGSVEKVEISPKLAQIAVNAAQILELDIAGVDLLESERGALVLEVNSSPGLEGIEKASRVNVAGAVANFLNEKLQAIESEKNQFDSESASSSAGDFTHAF
jgi:ribosomal protein S6--L-glutamate ligase